MKKVFKILGISLGILIGLLLLAAVLVPILFKDKLILAAKNIANENLNAVVDFQEMDVSVFKNFPNITVSMKNFTVVGVDKFKGDTLAAIESFSAGINVMSYLKKSIVDVQSIEVSKPYVHAIILPDSSVNWDIMKEDASGTTVDTSSSSFNLTINSFAVHQGIVVYEDREGKIITGLSGLEFKMKGDLSEKETVLNMSGACDQFQFFYEDVQYISNASFGFKSRVDADLSKMEFKLKETEVEINKIAMNVDGSINMKGDDINMDLTYGAKVNSLKTLLDMIPSSMMAEAKNVTTKGEMSMKGWIKGTYNEKSLPQVWAEMLVNDGYVKYAGMANDIKSINIDAKILYDGNDDSKTAIDVNRFHLEIAGNPFEFTTSVRTPMTNANIKAMLKGKIDFASLATALPLDGIKIKGVMNANINFAGKMSDIDKEQYDKLVLEGTFDLKNFVAETKDFPLPVDINSATMEFTPQYVSLKSFDCKIGESDIQASGRLDNILNYALKNEQLKGNLQLTSKYINCNQLMSGQETTGANPADSVPLSVFVIPANLDVNCNAKIGKVLYDNITLNNMSGGVGLNKGVLNMNNITAQFAGGTIGLSGNYRAENVKSALVAMNMSLNRIQIKDIVNSFDMFNKVLPFLRGVDGKTTINMNFSTKMDEKMDPVLMSMNATGNFSGDSLQLMNAESLNKITSLLNMKQSSNMLKKVNASFTITNGRIGVSPFAAALGTTDFIIGGTYGLDESLDAHVDVKVPANSIPGASGLLSQLGDLSSLVGSKSMNIGIAIGGTIKSPSFKLAKAQYTNLNLGKNTSLSPEELQLQNEKKETQPPTQVEEAKEVVNTLKNLFKKKN